MDINTKIFLAIFVLLLDLVAFFVPLTAIVFVVILIAKPQWFKDFVDELYKK